MTRRPPWISFHAPWTQRGRSGLVLVERMQRFLAAVAVDPSPQSAELTVYEDLGEELRQRSRGVDSTATNIRAALDAIGYQPGPLVAEVTEAMGGPGRHGTWASGSSGFLMRWSWERKAPLDPAPLIALYTRHEADPPVASAPAKRGVGLTFYYSFEVKRPGATAPLFPGASLRSNLLLMVDHRHANLSIRYESPEMTPELRVAHDEIVAALGPKTPRHALSRVVTSPTGRETSRRLT